MKEEARSRLRQACIGPRQGSKIKATRPAVAASGGRPGRRRGAGGSGSTEKASCEPARAPVPRVTDRRAMRPAGPTPWAVTATIAGARHRGPGGRHKDRTYPRHRTYFTDTTMLPATSRGLAPTGTATRSGCHSQTLPTTAVLLRAPGFQQSTPLRNGLSRETTDSRDSGADHEASLLPRQSRRRPWVPARGFPRRGAAAGLSSDRGRPER
jgi:hypothetical protein